MMACQARIRVSVYGLCPVACMRMPLLSLRWESGYDQCWICFLVTLCFCL